MSHSSFCRLASFAISGAMLLFGAPQARAESASPSVATRAESASPFPTAGPPPPDSAAPVVASSRADQWFETARTLHAEQKWTAARDAYLRVWSLEKSVRVAANLALVELKLGSPRDAAEHLSFAMAHLPAEDPKTAETRERLEERLAEAKSQIGTVDLAVTDAGADVYVDEHSIGRTPLAAPVYVNLGRHVIRVSHAGMRDATREIVVDPGGGYRVEVSLVPKPVVEAEAEPSLKPVEDEQPHHINARTIVVAGGAALTVAAVTAGIVFAVERHDAASRATDLEDELAHSADPALVAQQSECSPTLAARPSQCDALARARRDEDAAGQRSTIAFVAGAGVAVATVATYFLWPQKSAPSAQSRAVHVAFGVSPNEQTVTLRGAF